MDNPAILSLIARVKATGAKLGRHGNFIGAIHPQLLTPELWAEIELHEAALLAYLPDLPTPYQQRQKGGKA